MIVRMKDFNLLLKKLKNELSQDGRWCYFQHHETVNPLSVFSTKTIEEHWHWADREDEIEHYQVYYLPNLIGTMRAIKKGLIDLDSHLAYDKKIPGFCVNLRDIYLLQLYPQWLECLKSDIEKIDRNKPEASASINFCKYNIAHSLTDLSLIPGGMELARKWWHENKPIISQSALFEEDLTTTPILERKSFRPIPKSGQVVIPDAYMTIESNRTRFGKSI